MRKIHPDQLKANKKAGNRAWELKNPERVHAIKAKYVAAHKERVAAAKKKWRLENPEKMQQCRTAWIGKGDNKKKRRASILAWQQKNIEKVRADTKKYRDSHKEEMKKWVADWGKRNKGKLRAYARRRQAAKLMAVPSWANEFFMEEAYDLARRRSELKTGGHAKWHVDHIVPLRSKLVCGLHVHNNLRVIPGSLNCSKSNLYWPDMP